MTATACEPAALIHDGDTAAVRPAPQAAAQAQATRAAADVEQHEPGDEATASEVDEEDLLDFDDPVTSEWLSAAADACLPAVAGAERLLGVWRAVGTMPDSTTRVDEEFVLRQQGGRIVGGHCPNADEPFSITGLTTKPAPEVHDGALSVSFVQLYPDGAKTQWRGILPDGDAVLRDGSWQGEADGTFRAVRVCETEDEFIRAEPVPAEGSTASEQDSHDTDDGQTADTAAMGVETMQGATATAEVKQSQHKEQPQEERAQEKLDVPAAVPEIQVQGEPAQHVHPVQQAVQQRQHQTRKISREERLQLAKQKQEEFRKQMEAKQQGSSSSTQGQTAPATGSYKPAWRELPAEIAASIPNDTTTTTTTSKGTKRPSDTLLQSSDHVKRQTRRDDDACGVACNQQDDNTLDCPRTCSSISDGQLELVKTLNSSQQQAALSDISRPLLILAGPGSGKTATLTHRILHFLASGVQPSQILAVSFTNAAAAEMGSRVKKLVKEARSKGLLPELLSEPDKSPDDKAAELDTSVSTDVETSTFHSVALKIVRDHAHLLGLTADFQLFGDSQQYNVVREGMRRFRQEGSSLAAAAPGTTGFNPPRRDVTNCMKELNQARAQQKKISATKSPELAFVSKHYTDVLKHCDAIDFQDILTKSLEVMQRHPEVQKQFHEQYTYILVDEFQDTNKIQYDLMRAIVSDDRLTVVGDDDQSIFAFQGATGRDVFGNMRTDFPGIRSVRLEQNYRSTGHIVAASSAVIKKSLSREEKQAISMQHPGDPIFVVNCPCAAVEADYVLKAIQFEANKADIKLSDIAILYRRKTTGQYFQQKLLEQGIPFNHHDVCFYRRKMVKAVIFLMRVAANRKDDASFEKAYKPLLEDYGLDTAAAKRVLERARTIADVETLSMYEAAKRVVNVKVSGSLNPQMLAAGRKALRSIDLVLQRAPKSTVSSLLEFAVTMFKAKEKFNLPISSQSQGKEGMLLNDSKETRTPMQVLLDDIEAFEDSRASNSKECASECVDSDSDGGMPEAAGLISISAEDATACQSDGDVVSSVADGRQSTSPQEHEHEHEQEQENDGRNEEQKQKSEHLTELRAFLSYITEVEEDKYKQIKSDNDNAISLLTIHRSKGLEWKIVFVIKMNEGELPMSFDQEELEKSKESTGLQEERRLCFVAWSRASTRLYLTYRLQGDRTGEVLQASRYLSDLDRKTLQYIEWRPEGVALDSEQTGDANALSCDPSDHVFYKQIAHEHRASASMLFNKWSKQKAFASNPTRLVAKVKAVCIERLAQGSREASRPALNDLLKQIKANAEQAADYGRVWSEFQKLPEDQKWERQQKRAAEFQKASGDAKLAGRKPSDAQIGYLRKLGCHQVPKDALEASRLISEFKKR